MRSLRVRSSSSPSRLRSTSLLQLRASAQSARKVPSYRLPIFRMDRCSDPVEHARPQERPPQPHLDNAIGRLSWQPSYPDHSPEFGGECQELSDGFYDLDGNEHQYFAFDANFPGMSLPPLSEGYEGLRYVGPGQFGSYQVANNSSPDYAESQLADTGPMRSSFIAPEVSLALSHRTLIARKKIRNTLS
ncbi:hypothetical protein IWX49DRAFT_635431 [Phyllosticta citricarpa]